jgi:hypothetical protein
MFHRIMLAAALIAVPAIVVAEQPARATAHAQQAEPAKPKKHSKKGMHKKSGKTAAPKAAAPKAAAPKAAPQDTGSAK